MPKKFRCLVFAIFIAFFSCTSTQIYPRLKCHICLSQPDGILLLPLAWNSGFNQLTPGEQNVIEQKILDILINEGFTKVELYDRLNAELFNAGIIDPNDSTQRSKISSNLGYKYLLGLSLGEMRNADTWDYRSEQQLYEMNPPSPDQEFSAMVRIALIETSTGNIVSDNTIFTKIDGWGIPDKEGGVDYWNFGSLSQVIRKASQKGTENFIKDCGCEKSG